MPNKIAQLDDVFHALADPTRRAVLEQLSRGPAAVSTLAAPFEMALPSFLQHLRVLEDSGLVRSKKAGRVRTFQVVPRSIAVADDWLGKQRSLWEQRLDRFDAYVESLKETKK